MSRTVAAAYDPPDPGRMLPGPILSAEIRKLGRAVNKLNADPGPPPIRMGWCQGQFAHSGARVTYQSYPIPEWSPAHTAQGLWCRVRTNVFGGAGAVVRFTSVATGNFVEVNPGGSAGWYDAVDLLVCDFAGGTDTVEVSVGTGSGTLTIQAISCVWVELPSPLDAGANGDVLPFDDGETADDAPLSARLGKALMTSLAALEERVWVHCCWAGLDGIVYSGVDCSVMAPTQHWIWTLVWPGTNEHDWRLTWAMNAAGAGAVLCIHGPAGGVDQRGAPTNQTEIDAPSGDFRLLETAFARALDPLETSDFDLLPGGIDGALGDPGASALMIWGR